jgi:predicted RNA binding protein YcfA (HicA-like mRNA interferase family)
MGNKRHRPHRLITERPRDVIRALNKICYKSGVMKGDDLALIPTCPLSKERNRKIVTIPVGRKELLTSTLEYILRNADVSTQEFLDLRYER